MAAQGTQKGKVRMENYSTTTNANDAEFPHAGAKPDGNTTEAASEPTALTGAGPVAAGGAKDRSMDPGRGRQQQRRTLRRQRPPRPTLSTAMRKVPPQNRCASSCALRSQSAPAITI